MELEQALLGFYTRNRGIELFSTGARVVNYHDVLYNVEGSTDDPQIDGQSWKRLLQEHEIDGDCYATNPLPEDGEDSSHPNFSVGGHMTPSSVGYVEPGGICYLMPLCSWHNSTRRDRTPFEHDETSMLELSGYMEGELAATFAARLPGHAEHRLVSVEGDALVIRAIDEPLVALLDVHRNTGVADPALPQTYLRFRRVEKDGAVRFVIDDARLPALG